VESGAAADNRRRNRQKKLPPERCYSYASIYPTVALSEVVQMAKTKIDLVKTFGTAADGRKIGTEKAGVTKKTQK
jgi:hypothetical protein